MKIKLYLPGAYFLGAMAIIPTLYAAPLAKNDLIVIDDLFIKTKPQCVGIYIVDVPESFDNRTHIATYDDFKIESKFIDLPAFEQRMKLREQALHDAINRPENEPENAPFIKEIIRLPDNQGVIFDKNKNGYDDIYRKLEAHVYLNPIAFIITTDFRDFSDKKNEERKKHYLERGFTEAESNQKPAKLAAMRSLISRLNGRLNHDLPTQKGVCIPNGFISDDGRNHKVVIGFSYKNDDFLLGINTDNTRIADGDTFFERNDVINDALKNLNMKTLKKYAAMANSIPFEAWLFNGVQDNRQKMLQVYDFTLYANEAVATASKPRVTIGLDSKYKYTRYSEAQMVEIWDRIVGSLRYKPSAF